ncbi:hypothetical protein K1719_011234 [Acacia pycnantha]|nr:hypothetical protein K1719_011234 [Acacia pycnantha]
MPNGAGFSRGPFMGFDSFGNNVKHQKRLQGPQITGLKQEVLKLGVKLVLNSIISGGENGNIVGGDGILECVQEKRLLHKLSKLSVMEIEKHDKNGIRVGLRGGWRRRRRIKGGGVRQCKKERQKSEEEEGGDTIDSRIHENNNVETIKSFDESCTKPTFGWGPRTYFPKVLGDIVESLAGAIMVDSGFNKDIVIKSIMPLLEPLITPGTIHIHLVCELQELCQKQYYKFEKPLVSTSEGLTWVKVQVLANGKTYEKTFIVGTKDNQKIACKEVLTYLKKINSI